MIEVYLLAWPETLWLIVAARYLSATRRIRDVDWLTDVISAIGRI